MKWAREGRREDTDRNRDLGERQGDLYEKARESKTARGFPGKVAYPVLAAVGTLELQLP